MLKVDVFLTSGKKSGQLALPKEIFGAKVNEPLIAQAVRVYLSNQRKAKAKVKTRGEVQGSRVKIWRQKGTGRARHGDRYAPLFVGGGVAHGPTGQENYHLKMSRKMKRKALFAALSAQLKKENILVIKDLAKIEPKTKKMAQVLANLQLTGQKILLVLPEKVAHLSRAAGNIEKLRLLTAGLLNPYQVLEAQKIVFLPDSIEKLKTFFLKKE